MNTSTPSAPTPSTPAQPEMSQSPAVAVVERLYEQVWNGRRYALADELFAADYAHPSVPDLRGGAAKAAVIRGYHAAFPDLAITVNERVAADDRVAVRLTITGTDTGGFRGKAPSGRKINAWGVEFLRIQDGRIVEDWIGADWLGMLEQLGVINSPWT